jgi:chromosome segregation ATPase
MLDDQVKGRLTSLERLCAEHDERIAINDREMHLQVDRLDRHNEERGKEVNRFISDLQARYADQRSEISDLRAAANEAVKVDTSHHQRIKLAEAKLAEWEPMISTVEFATTRVLGNLREEGELRNKEDVRLHQRIDAAEATIREEGELRMKADVTLSAAIANLAKEFERHRKAPDDHGIAILETTPPGFITPAAQAPLVLSDQELIDLAHLARVAKPGVTLGLEFVAAQRIDALWVRLEREQERRALRNVPR